MSDESRVSLVGSSDGLPNSDNSNDSIDTQVTKKRKEIQCRSKVWVHYDKITNDNGICIGKAKCRYCSASLAYKSANGTTGLKQHIERCPVYKLVDECPTQKKINFTNKDEPLSLWEFDQALVRRALVEMIIVDELPFSFVEKEGFKKFMNQAQPLFRIPSRRTITRDCYELYGELRYSLKNSFREAHPKICLTTDTWTSMQRINYMCLTAHFIDRNWVLHKRILNFCPISSHKGDQMADAIGNCLLDWNLDNVFCVTVDNAASNSVTVVELSKQLDMWGTNIMDGKHLHMRCMAHILNLIVHEGLKEIGNSVKRVRQIVRYVRSSPARIRSFVKCCEVQKIECTKLLSLDVPTRWNSTYEMLETAQHFEKAFDRFDLFDPNFKAFLSTHICEDGSVAGLLECDDWVNVRNVVKFLKKFYELTVKISGSHYVTSNVHFEDICELDVYLKACLANAPRFPILSELARDVLAIPISSVASECAFSTGGRILDRFRSSLTPKCVQSLVCGQDWLRKESKSICVEESLEYLEQLEVEMTNNGRDPCIVDV